MSEDDSNPKLPSTELIRLHARLLWEREGKPEDRNEQIWFRAKAQVLGEDRFELLDAMSQDDLSEIVSALANLTGLSGGIVRNPPSGTRPPETRGEFETWRLTPVINPSDFCKAIRACHEGDFRCMWSDLEYAAEAEQKAAAVKYECHQFLTDFVAPIKVGGRHVANIYLGQVRTEGMDFEKVFARYTELISKSGPEAKAITKDELRDAYNKLPTKTPEEAERIRILLYRVAQLISERATRHVTLRALSEAAEAIGPTIELGAALAVFWNTCKRLVACDTGSISLLDEESQLLVPRYIDWGGPRPPDFFRRDDHGLLPLIWKTGDAKRYDTRAKMDEVVPPKDESSREKRGIESFLGVPIKYGDTFLGVLEVGSKRKAAFSRDDENLLLALARQIGVFVKTLQARISFINMIGEDNPEQLATAITKHVPSMVAGIGCSVFLKSSGGVDAFLFASNELPLKEAARIFYEPGEGLTGWVLANGKPLRINAGPNARANVGDLYRGAKWEKKFIGYDKSGRDYSDKPWMGCPLKNKNGDVVGVIRVSDKERGSFTEEDQKVLQACADSIASVLEARNIHGPLTTLEKRMEQVHALQIEIRDTQAQLASKNDLLEARDAMLKQMTREHEDLRRLYEAQVKSFLHIGALGVLCLFVLYTVASFVGGE